MDGLECVRRLRLFEKGANVPFNERQLIIGVSANSDDSIIREVYEVKMDIFIPKPFSKKHIIEAYVKIKNVQTIDSKIV